MRETIKVVLINKTKTEPKKSRGPLVSNRKGKLRLKPSLEATLIMLATCTENKV